MSLDSSEAFGPPIVEEPCVGSIFGGDTSPTSGSTVEPVSGGLIPVGVASVSGEASDSLGSVSLSAVGLATVVKSVIGFSVDVWFSLIRIDEPRSLTKVGVP